MDNVDGFLNDLQFLLGHIHGTSEVAVKKWSVISCKDYQLPIIRLASYLNSFNQQDTLPVRDIPEHRVMVDIVARSRLSDLLEYRDQERCIKYRDSVPITLRERVRMFIMDHTGAIGETG